MPPEQIGPGSSATRGTGPNSFKDDEHQLDKSSVPETQGYDEEQQQRCLSLRWETKHHWPELRKEFGVSKTGAAMILSLVTAGDWVRYSRHAEFYSLPQRYRNPLFTYRRVTRQADYLEREGLIDHAKSQPGQRGWQSAMKATPELIAKTNLIIQDPTHHGQAARGHYPARSRQAARR